MLNIGCHLSTAKGFLHMGRTALSIGASTFQFFMRNPRGGKAKDLVPADLAAFAMLARGRSPGPNGLGPNGRRANALGPLIAHASYTLNPCAANPDTRRFAIETLHDDLRRLAALPAGTLYNLHPGCHGQGVVAGIKAIAAALDEAMPADCATVVLLETMAGKGSEVGGSFGELRAIIDASARAERLGVCLDTCHVFDAGYDIVDDLDGVLAEFDAAIGLPRLRAVHLNDSMNPRGSRKDRHARLGEGHIGIDALARVVNHPRLRHLPFVLETPNDLPGYAREIALMRGLAKAED
ncbi:MAG: endonuclease IV [Desulfovibrionaceae bacterium CG1_02_65_16]|nr:MAG: endonuclease IV [Desulfovibrionaceae bacterium CG1_02_65_16]